MTSDAEFQFSQRVRAAKEESFLFAYILMLADK